MEKVAASEVAKKMKRHYVEPFSVVKKNLSELESNWRNGVGVTYHRLVWTLKEKLPNYVILRRWELRLKTKIIP